jgi:hypothetical protein
MRTIARLPVSSIHEKSLSTESVKDWYVRWPLEHPIAAANGYVYSSSDITAKTYCVHADRANEKCGSRDFIVCEDGVIRFIESENRGAAKGGR